MTQAYFKFIMAVYKNQQKIIQQNTRIIELMEAMVDDANLVTELQERLNKSRQAMRELEYEQWFEKHKNE